MLKYWDSSLFGAFLLLVVYTSPELCSNLFLIILFQVDQAKFLAYQKHPL